MANWARNIARSAPEDVQNESLEDLFVFGYQCKLFRDDEKAHYLEEERHLIPWMGDSSLMIDRSVLLPEDICHTTGELTPKGSDFDWVDFL